jgi:8-oxo-dGTP pyrophosphatase MutT (NUDIX family)
MILGENQQVNVVVRGVIIEEGELVLTEWVDKPAAFLLGGRIDFGESIMAAIHREIMEETGTAVTVEKLLYFSEQVFADQHGQQIHEYGYYFWVQTERQICKPGEILPNPDHPQLIIRCTPITTDGLWNVWPRFLRTYLPQDFANQFGQCPRFFYARDGSEIAQESAALAKALGF